MFSEFDASLLDEKFTYSLSDDITSGKFQATAGSRMLEGYHPLFDAAVVSRMGASPMGKTNMDEFGFGMFSVTGTDIPRNPFGSERSCGGSSGGAACAAALFEDHVALGTSGGGSITSPAALCGIFGLTPTHGRVSRHGQIDGVSSMGPIGILAAESELLKNCLPLISGKDDRDPVSIAQPEFKLKKKKLKTAAIPKGIADSAGAEVRKAFNDSIELLKSMSVDIETVDMPHMEYAMSAHYVVNVTEAATNLVQYCGMRCGRMDGDLSLPFNDYFVSFRSKYFGTEAKLRAIMGTYVTAGDNREKMYLKSLGIRKLVTDDYKKVFAEHDVILTPSMPFTAPTIDDAIRMSSADSYTASRFAAPPVFCGFPCLSVPCGYSDGLPIGMQFISDHWDEDVLLSAAELWEKSFSVKTAEART